MAEALAHVGHPFIHVKDAIAVPTGTVAGQSPASDEAISKWCASTAYVLVTCDEDFRGRWERTGLLASHGVEVIVFNRELVGLLEQHRRITLHMPRWKAELERRPYGYRVWDQHPDGGPHLRAGKKGNPRSRRSPTIGDALARKERLDKAHSPRP